MHVRANMISTQMLYTMVTQVVTMMQSLAFSMVPLLFRMVVIVFLLVQGVAMNIHYQVIAKIKVTIVDLL